MISSIPIYFTVKQNPNTYINFRSILTWEQCQWWCTPLTPTTKERVPLYYMQLNVIPGKPLLGRRLTHYQGIHSQTGCKMRLNSGEVLLLSYPYKKRFTTSSFCFTWTSISGKLVSVVLVGNHSSWKASLNYSKAAINLLNLPVFSYFIQIRNLWIFLRLTLPQGEMALVSVTTDSSMYNDFFS